MKKKEVELIFDNIIIKTSPMKWALVFCSGISIVGNVYILQIPDAIPE
jgi:MFS family permease